MTSAPSLPPHDHADATPDPQVLHAAFAPARLDAATVQRLLRAVQLHPQPPGPVTLPPAASNPAWWLVARGRVAVGQWSPRDGLLERRVVAAGEWLDVASAWSGGDWIEAAECRTPALLWALPLPALVQAGAASPALLDAMGRVLAAQVRALADQRNGLATHDALARVAQWLLGQAPADARNGTTVIVHEHKQSVARQLAMTKETLSRCLRRLVKLGLLQVSAYRVVLQDLAGLAAVARPDRRLQRTRRTPAPA